MTKIALKSMSILKRITFARSLDLTKPTLSGVVLEPNGLGKVFAAATNGFLLAWGVLDLDEPNDLLARRLIIPGRLAEQIGKSVIGKKTVQFVEIGDESAWLHRMGLPSLSMRWIDGDFPSWQKVVPSPDAVKPWAAGRWATGTLEMASKALGSDSGFLPKAVMVSSGCCVAFHDGVFVQAVPMSFSTNHEEELAQDLRSALRDCSPLEKSA